VPHYRACVHAYLRSNGYCGTVLPEVLPAYETTGLPPMRGTVYESLAPFLFSRYSRLRSWGSRERVFVDVVGTLGYESEDWDFGFWQGWG